MAMQTSLTSGLHYLSFLRPTGSWFHTHLILNSSHQAFIPGLHISLLKYSIVTTGLSVLIFTLFQSAHWCWIVSHKYISVPSLSVLKSFLGLQFQNRVKTSQIYNYYHIQSTSWIPFNASKSLHMHMFSSKCTQSFNILCLCSHYSIIWNSLFLLLFENTYIFTEKQLLEHVLTTTKWCRLSLFFLLYPPKNAIIMHTIIHHNYQLSFPSSHKTRLLEKNNLYSSLNAIYLIKCLI